MEVMLFPKTMAECGHLLADDALVAVRGRLDDRDDAPKLIAMDIKRIEIDLEGGGPPLRLVLPEAMHPDKVSELRQLLATHPGDSEVFVQSGRRVVRLPKEFRVDGSTRLISELRVLLGADSLVA